MPAIRQQRKRRNERVLLRAPLVPPVPIEWTAVVLPDGKVIITPLPVPQTYVSSGILAMVDTTTAGVAVAQTPNQPYVTLNFSVPCVPGDEVQLGENDPAWRNEFGQYLKAQAFTTPPANPFTFLWTPALPSGNQVLLNLEGGLGGYVAAEVPIIQNVTSGEFAGSAFLSGDTLLLTFPGAVSTGDTLDWTTTTTGVFTLDGRQSVGGMQVCP